MWKHRKNIQILFMEINYKKHKKDAFKYNRIHPKIL